MGLIGGNLAYWMLRCISSTRKVLPTSVDCYESRAHKLKTHFGENVFEQLRDKTVVDFGSGRGGEAVEIAIQGAGKVIGVELQERFRVESRERAEGQGVADRCKFVSATDEKADVVYSLDSFEHFEDPESILRLMAGHVCDEGEVWISFGLPWFHPHGGHIFSVFPWAHLIFTESALIRWRSDFKDDGATQFHEIAGGLNQMTISRFESLINESPLEVREFRITPIRKLRPIHCRATREFTTTLIFARLTKPQSADA